MAVIINGRDLTIEQVISVCRHHEKVELAPEAIEAVNKARAYVEKKVAEKAVVYGLTTGFGKFASVAIDTDQTAELQRNLIISHTCSMGKPYDQKYVRAAMLLRANSLSRGNSGIRLETLQTLIDMLNAGIHPIVPEKGSVGASGDLAPLSCIALGLIGLGKVEYKGEVIEAKEAFEKAGLKPVVLASKEGLALNNGTQMLTAVGLNTLYDAMHLMKIADIAAALTGEALHAIAKAYDPKTHLLRGHQGQMDVAENMRNLLAGSGNALPLHPTKVQDPYSQRCMPQIHGASRDAIMYVYEAVSREINAVTDNPIVFPDDDEVISGGNFHGQPMALAFDFLKIAISELANVAERRTERLVNPALSEGLPAFLVKDGGLNNGFMIAQYASASMVSENKVWAHPASVDSIPSSANQEDHVSMGTTAARKLKVIVGNLYSVLSFELMSAVQGIELRGEQEALSPVHEALFQLVRRDVPFMAEDHELRVDITAMNALMRSGEIPTLVHRFLPEL